MPNCNPFREHIANQLRIEVFAATEAAYLRRRSEAIVDLLYGMEKLRRLRGDVESYASVQDMGRRG